MLRIDKREDAYEWAERGVRLSDSIDMPIEDRPQQTSGLEIGPTHPVDALRECSDAISPIHGDALRIGSILTWEALQRRFEWESDKHGYYLPEKDGQIVCACLRAEMNPAAPWEILVGTEPAHIRKAELLARQSSPIPVFVKLKVDHWEHWGRFRLERTEKDYGRFAHLLPENRRKNTSMVLFLKDAS